MQAARASKVINFPLKLEMSLRVAFEERGSLSR